jgi:type I restriction enzyme S subunit
MSGFLRLGDHCKKIGSGSTPRGGHKSYVPTGIPLIRSQNVLMGSFTRQGLVRIPPEVHAEMAATEVQSGDVLLNITGASIGRVCVVPDEVCPANVNQHVCIIRCCTKLNPHFVATYLSSPKFQKLIMDTQAGGTRQALTKSDIEDFVVPELPIDEQTRLSERIRSLLEVIKIAQGATCHQASELSLLANSIVTDSLCEAQKRTLLYSKRLVRATPHNCEGNINAQAHET